MLLCEANYDERKHDERIRAIPRSLPISGIIEAVVAAYLDLYGLNEASEINQGMCEDFAEDVCSLVPGAEAYWDDELGNYDSDDVATGSHKVIAYQGKFHDSQCPEGTDDWRTLLR